MLSLFSCIAASKLYELYVKTPSKTKPVLTITIDNKEKFITVYEKVSKELDVPLTSLKITKGRSIPHRCMTLLENHIQNHDRLLLTYVNEKSVESNAQKPTKVSKFDGRKIAKKPVIYIYPTEEIDATVSIHPD